MKRAGLNNQPHHRRDYGRRTVPCGKVEPTWGGCWRRCALDKDHKGRCQGPIRGSK